MADRHGSPVGLELRVEVHWCAQCRGECMVQIVHLASDPEPVAMCAQCGAGVDMWLSADVVDPSAGALTDRAGGHIASRATGLHRSAHQGAA